MIIRCPQCDHTRSITESKIPATAELATCPKCKHRFRFRTLRPPMEPVAPERSPVRAARSGGAKSESAAIPAEREMQHPQSALRETAPQDDIWDAMDALHHRWQKQMEQNVTEVETPRPQGSFQEASSPAGEEEPEPTSPPPLSHDERAAAPEAEADAAPAAQQALSPAGGEEPAVPMGAQTPPPLSHQEDDDEEARKGHFIFPYADGGPDPEERVEHDLRMLHDASTERPTRDLGALREFPEPARTENGTVRKRVPSEEESPDDQELLRTLGLEDSGIPWENPAMNGWLRGFMSTVHAVMFRSPIFFSSMSGGGSLAPGYLFFLIMGYVTILGSLAWTHAATILLPELSPMLSGRVALPVLLLLAPIALGLMLLFVTGFMRVTVRLLAPEHADFALIYKISSYSVAPFILSIVPFVGPPLGSLWFIATLIAGCRNALGLSWPLAVLTPLLPAGMLLAGIVYYFL